VEPSVLIYMHSSYRWSIPTNSRGNSITILRCLGCVVRNGAVGVVVAKSDEPAAAAAAVRRTGVGVAVAV